MQGSGEQVYRGEVRQERNDTEGGQGPLVIQQDESNRGNGPFEN